MNNPPSPKPDLVNTDHDAVLQTWAEANKAGFQALNEFIEREGFPLLRHRLF